jgi:hypothetical protein
MVQLIFAPILHGGGQLHTPAALPPRKNSCTHFIGGWVGSRACLNVIRREKCPVLAGNRKLAVQPGAYSLCWLNCLWFPWKVCFFVMEWRFYLLRQISLVLLSTNSLHMEQSHFWESLKEIHSPLWNPKVSLPFSRKPTTGPYSDSNESNPHLHIFLYDPF